MKLSLLFLVLLFHLFSYGQRSGRSAYSSTPVYEQPTFSGRYFNVTLTNTDTTSALLRLGPGKRIDNNDTLNLARIYPCNNPAISEYYDLDYFVSEENNCVRWYALQLIKPRDSLHFTVKLKDFAEADTARLYFCFTNEIKQVDKDLDFYVDPKKIFIRKDGRDFKTSYLRLSPTETNLVLLQCGQ